MKTFDGNVEKHIIVSGRVQKAEPDFTADVKPKTEITEAKVKKENVFSGIALFALNAVSGVVKVLTALYRFIFSHSIIRQMHSAKANTAPATVIESDSEINVGNEANLATAPANDANTDSKVKTSVYSKLVAYRRAAAVYIKKMFLKTIAGLQAAPGKCARYRKAVKMKQESKTIAADSAIMDSQSNLVETGCDAVAESAPENVVPGAESTFTAEHTATASTAAVSPVNINSLFKVSHIARLYAWFLAEQSGNELKLFQVFSGIQSGNVLEIDLETESAYWANAIVTDGALNLVFAETATQNDTILEVV